MWKLRNVRKPFLMLDLTCAALMSTEIASRIVKPYSKASLVYQNSDPSCPTPNEIQRT